MLGFAASNASTFAWIAFSSLGALQPCQKVIVVSAFGSSLAPPLELPVQALPPTAITNAMAVAPAVRWIRGMVSHLLFRAPQVLLTACVD